MKVTDEALLKQMKEWRHYLHAHAETAFEEKVTSEYVAGILSDLGLRVHKNIGSTGIVATLSSGDNKKIIGLRADMDAINLIETGDIPHCSLNNGKMHACGHDGHMATLLGAAKLLADHKSFNGTVVFIFQPAEEPGKGAHAMINDGLFERFPMDEIYGLHNIPQLPEGTFHTRVGGIMASEDNFVIRIKGKGTHASAPHIGIDPLVIASEIILSLQTIVSRCVNPLTPAVISCTEIHTDGAHNAIPTNVRIMGDTRSYTPEIQELIENQMKSISEGICQMHGAKCEFEYTHEFTPTTNWEKCVKTAVEAANSVVGEENVNSNCEPLMVSEDFGAFTQKIPGCFIFLGSGKHAKATDNIPLHNSVYDYNDDILGIGAEFFVELVRRRTGVRD